MPYQRFSNRPGIYWNYKPYTGPTRASILRGNSSDWIKVISPFDQRYVDELKTMIQPTHRRWDATEKVWHVHTLFLDTVVMLTKKFFDEVTTDLIDSPTDDGNLFRQVFETIPKDYIDKVYFALSQACHPDHGGTNEMMSQLNQAYEGAKQ